jgi:dTDP-4-dehydrorhamnose 3,5-epimerase
MNYIPTPENKITDEVYKTSINGLYYISHKTFPDERGFFSELGKLTEILQIVQSNFTVKQISQARSYPNVIRGIHGEDWSKYISVTSGIAFSAIIDLRPESKTFMKKEQFLLGFGENTLDGSLLIPARCGNSMCVVEGPVNYLYLFDKLYKDRDPKGDVAVSLFDPDLNIQWPIPREQMIISQRDLKAVTLRQCFPEKF